MASQFADMTPSANFLTLFVSLVKFTYWSNFYVNTTFGVKRIFIYWGLTRNPKIRNTPVCILPKTCRLGRDRDTKFGTNVSDKMLLILQNARVTAFTVSELLKENQQSGGKITSPTSRLGLMRKILALKQYVIWSENLNVVKNIKSDYTKNWKKISRGTFSEHQAVTAVTAL